MVNFNIGGGSSISLSLLELFSRLSDLLAIPPLAYTLKPRRASDQDCFIADIRKAERLFNWVPAISCRAAFTPCLIGQRTICLASKMLQGGSGDIKQSASPLSCACKSGFKFHIQANSRIFLLRRFWSVQIELSCL